MIVEGDYGMDINDDGPGSTPLKKAKDKGHNAIVRFLESHGAAEWRTILSNVLLQLITFSLIFH